MILLWSRVSISVDRSNRVKVKGKGAGFFIVRYQVWRPIIGLYILPSGHWTCWFMCHFNSPGAYSPAAVSVHWTYRTHCHLFLTRYSFSPESSEAFGGEMSCPRTHHLNNGSKMERGETWYFSENPASSGIRNRTAGSDIGRAPRSNHCAMSLSSTKCSDTSLVHIRNNVTFKLSLRPFR